MSVELLTTKELALYLKITTRAITNFINDGMPVVRVGSRNRFELEKVLNWLQEQHNKKEENK